jgi:uncharacterized protein
MPTDLIRYDLQVQDALRGVVRKVLEDAAREGLPGEHHFYITFRTQAPGVKLSARLREQYPNEMTIILQYQFWDLQVDDEGFHVGLHFKNIPERLQIPFEAITGFYDPSVQFGLKFEASGEEEEGDIVDEGTDEVQETAPGPVANLPRPAPEAGKPKPRGAGSEPAMVPGKAPPEPARVKAGKAKDDKASKGGRTADEKPAAPAAPAAEGGESKVVSIDAFRKKT